jgi:hypothetical protein
MKFRIVALTIIGIAVLVAVVRLYSPKPDQMPSQIPVRTVEKEWQEYSSPSNRFSVILPELPQHVVGGRPMPTGKEEIHYDTFLSMAKEGTVILINVIDYPSSVNVTDTKGVLQAAVDEIRGSNPANQILKNEVGVSLGYPSMDFTIGNKEAAVQGRAILKGHALFVLTVADPDPRVASSVFTKMADSFRIITE